MKGFRYGLAAVALFTASACSVVKHTRTREDWDTVDAQRVKRLVILTQPLPVGSEKVAELWNTIAAKRVDSKREFIIKEKVARADEGAADLRAHCAEGVEGVLWLRPDVRREGKGVEAAVNAQLIRCVDGEQVWATEAAGSWPSQEEGLKETVASYVSDLGPEVEPFVVATYHLLHATLDTLPNPVLTEEDQGEKIEYTQ